MALVLVVAPGFGLPGVKVARLAVVVAVAEAVQLASLDSPARSVLVSPPAVLLAVAVQGLVPSALLPSGQVLLT